MQEFQRLLGSGFINGVYDVKDYKVVNMFEAEFRHSKGIKNAKLTLFPLQIIY
jgi:hypothetical protein